MTDSPLTLLRSDSIVETGQRLLSRTSCDDTKLRTRFMLIPRTILSVFLSGVLIATSLPVAAQTVTPGQISGVARASNANALSAHPARLPSASTGNAGGSAPISATGDFSFAGVPYGQYLVEIVNP